MAAQALAAVEKVYLPAQEKWKITDDLKIAKFAAFAVNFPFRWGRCVQQSLIVYRLLNGYGIPARICFGVSLKNPLSEGHAWVVKLSEPDKAFAESFDPGERFKTVYVSPNP